MSVLFSKEAVAKAVCSSIEMSASGLDHFIKQLPAGVRSKIGMLCYVAVSRRKETVEALKSQIEKHEAEVKRLVQEFEERVSSLGGSSDCQFVELVLMTYETKARCELLSESVRLRVKTIIDIENEIENLESLEQHARVSLVH